MALKKSFLNLDHRHFILPLVFVPFLLWIAALVIAVMYWRQRGLLIGAGLFFLGGWIATKLHVLEYKLALRGLPHPPPGEPGKDHLLFHAERPDTVNKLKILPEDAGFIWADDQGYRLITLQHDCRLPIGTFHQEFIKNKGEIKGVILRGQPEGSEKPIELAVSFLYTGKDMELAGSVPRKNEWGAEVLKTMYRGKAPPALPEEALEA